MPLIRRNYLLVGLLAATACQPPSAADSTPAAGERPAQTMIHIPAGPFLRGCEPAAAQTLGIECEGDPAAHTALNTPAREITLSEYWIDQFEVTIGEYRACLDAGVCHESPTSPSTLVDEAKRDRVPVTGVSWAQAVRYCEWRGKRLPTEAEWEKAARGTDGRMFPWGDALPKCGDANLRIIGVECPDEARRPVPVDLYPADVSPHGVRGMAGNVQEWVADWRVLDEYTSSPSLDPTGPEQPPTVKFPRRVIRGGYYDAPLPGWIVPIRRGATPDKRSARVGFRCASSTAPD